MKLTAVFFLTASLHVSANGNAQKLTLDMDNVSLEKVFKEIRKQTGYLFLYNNEALKKTGKVSVHVKDADIDEAISQSLASTGFTYRIMDKTIILSLKQLPANPVQTIKPDPVSGVIRDAEGKTVAGVSITNKRTTLTVVSDANGRFTINANAGDVIEITSIGYKAQQITISSGQSNINITLDIEFSQVTETIVVGYSTQKKANLTGAVDQVNAEALENRSITNLNQGLQGVLPNLNIKLLDGKPNQAPRFNIRGMTSIGQGGSALILIDGVEGDPSLINPNDVATVTILKDAASASIYGARGAFGVVLITTKNPSRGKTSLTYTNNYSVKQPTNLPDFENDAYIYAKYFAESFLAWENTFPTAVNKTLKFSQAYLTELERRSKLTGLPDTEIDPVTGEYVYYASTDWYKEMFKKNTVSREHNLTISGSGDKTGYLITGRYFGQDGLFRYNSDDYKILNFRAKGSVQVYPWLRVENNSDFANMTYHNPLNVGEGGGIFRNIADEGHPLAPMFNPDGTLTASSAYSVGDFWYGKNGFDLEKSVFKNKTSFTAQFLNDHLRFKGDFTFQITDNNEKRKQVPLPYSSKPGVIAFLGTTTNDLREIRQTTNYIATNFYTEYENVLWNDHYFKALLGYNYEQATNKNLLAQRNGLIFENANDINLALGNTILTSGGYEQWAILGGFGRLNYSFKEKYLLEVNGRYDGSSKFPFDQRYGFFPSVSAGWRISREKFWKVSDKFISDLKVRASYGSLGNGNIGSYVYLEQFNISQSGIILNGIRPQLTSRPSVLPDGLTWETSTTRNLGLDFAMLSNRLRFTGDVYLRETTDMFTIGVTLPAVFGATSPRGNYADLETKGWELSLSWGDKFNMGSKPFSYDVRLTLADNTSVITKYNNPEKRLTDYYEGMKVGEIWGYTTEGFFTSAADIASHANQKLFLSTSSGQTFPGDIKLKDINHDGFVNPGNNTVGNPGDRTIIGNSSPRYLYGINLGADWNNIFFSAFFQGVGKQDWFPSSEAGVFWGQYNRPYNKLPRWHLDNHWTVNNPNAYLPRYVSRLANRPGGILREAQTKYLQNIAYIRLKNVQLGYNLPARLISRIHASNIRIYVSAENIWTASPLYKLTKDIDPESTGPSDQMFTNTNNPNFGDAYNYPMMKGITFGLTITF